MVDELSVDQTPVDELTPHRRDISIIAKAISRILVSLQLMIRLHYGENCAKLVHFKERKKMFFIF